MRVTRSTRIAMLVPLVLVAAGCSRGAEGESGGKKGGPIKIGLTAALSGPSGSLGQAVKQGVQLKIDEINAKGGLLGGRQIQLVERDHEAVPDKGVTNMRELIEKEKVDALIGETTSGVALAEAPIVNAAGVPFVVTVSTATKVTEGSKSIYRVSLLDKAQTQVAFDAAKAKYKKIALLTDTSGYGQGGHTDLMAAMTAASVKPVADETYKVGDTDMTPQISKIKASGADVIINWGLGAEAAQIRRAMKQVGLDIPMIGSWGLSMPNYPELAGPLADGTLVVQAFSFEDPKAAALKEAYVKKFGTDKIEFPNGVANSYDGMGLLAAAIEKAGSTDKTAVNKALTEVEYDGVIKKYSAPWKDSKEALGAEDMFITRLEGGTFKKVEG